MKRKVFYTGLIVACWGCAGLSVTHAASPATGATSVEVQSIELSATAEGAQLTLDLTGSTRQRIFKLSNPDRTVVDLTHTRLARNAHAPPGDGLVEDVRTGTQPGGTLRVVVRVKATVGVRSVWARGGPTGGRRLVVTLGQGVVAPVRKSSFAAAQSGAATPGEAAVAAAPTVVKAARSPVTRSTGTAVPPTKADVLSTTSVLKIVRAAHAPAESDRDVIVAVDAGHGGKDPGAIGSGGTREKDVTLAIARVLAERINGEPGMRAVLTRNKDEFVVLRDRIGRARIAKADMFISVHADSIADHSISGASVYVLSEKGASNEAARWLAERENAADLMGGVKLDDKDNTLASVLMDLSQSANISASVTAAQGVLASLDGVGQVRKSEVQQARFVVLKSPDIPSMLVETAYISNPVEEARLRSAHDQDKLAEAIFQGVKGYFAQNPPSGTRFAQARHSTIADALTSPTASR